jgi:23S rRNA pseudouridine1911/1915/1917 synthase
MRVNRYNRDRYEHYQVKEEAPLLEWLLANLKQSKSKVKATLQGRGIKVDNKVVTQFDYMLVPGMQVSISKTKRNDSFKSRYVKIVYEDQYLVVIEKNIGILSMAAGHKSLNVKSVLDDYFHKSHQTCRAHVVHRLDRDTSGLMVYAKDMQTEQILEKNWHNIVYDRRYVAVLSGQMEDNDGTIANWLKDNKAYVTYSSPTDNGGKYAVTHFHVFDRSENHSLVEFKLETGRKNQIRVHAADMQHPVCGDVKYGNGDDPLHRLCLHAYVLCFHHPVTHESMEFETPIPTTFRSLF